MHIEEPGSHLDSLLVQTRREQMHLSAMADAKANILLTVSSLVITLSAKSLLDPRLHLPTLILLGFSLLTIILAAYAVMPKYNRHSPAPEQVGTHTFNLLFFGDFARLNYDEFADAMEKHMRDASSTYELQVRGIYNLGVFLARQKYRYIRLAYISFLTGFVVSGGVWLAESLLRRA